MHEAKKRVILYAAISPEQHEALRYIAFGERRSLADVTREAIDSYIQTKAGKYPAQAFGLEAEDVTTRPSTGQRRVS